MSLATLLEAAQFIEQQERVRGDSESIVLLSRMGVLMESSQANQSRAGQGYRPVDCYLQMYEKQQSLQQQHVTKLQHQQLNANRIQQQQLSIIRTQQQCDKLQQQQQIVDKLQQQQLNDNRFQQLNVNRIQQLNTDRLQQQQLNVNKLLPYPSYVRQQTLREPYHIEFPQHYIKEESEDIDVEELDVVAVSPHDRVTCVQSSALVFNGIARGGAGSPEDRTDSLGSALVRPEFNGIARGGAGSPQDTTDSLGSVLVRPQFNGIARGGAGSPRERTRTDSLGSGLVRPESNGSGGSPLRRKYENDKFEPAEASGRPPSPRVTSMPPPKKKWMRNYMEEEPCPPAQLLNGAGVSSGARAAPSAPIAIPPSACSAPRRPAAPSPGAPLTPAPLTPAHLLPVAAYLLDHDLPRARSNSNGSGGRAAGTREVHNKLEKNRRAHLKECFELLKRQLPASPDDKKSSNLSILDSAIKYIQVLKRRERECEHEMERLAREKISSQQRLAALRRGSPVAPRLHHPSNHDRESIIEDDNMHSLSRVASPGSCSSLSMMHSDQMSPSPRVSPPLPPLPSSLDLSTRPLRPTQPPQQSQMLNIQPNGIYPRLEQSPPPSIINRAPAPASTLIPFSHHLPNGLTGSIVATPGTLNLSVNPSSFNSVNTTHVFNTSPSHFNSAAASFNANQSFNNASFNSSFNASVSLAGKVAVRPANQLSSNGGSLPTLTVTTVNHGQVMAVNHGTSGIAQRERKILSTVPASVNGQTTIVHPAQLHLPLQQMMNGSGIVVSPTIQMFYTTPQTLRVLQGQGGALAPIDLPSTAANSPIQRMREVQKVGEAGTGAQRSNGAGQSVHHHIAIKPQPEGAKATLHAISQNGIMMNGLTPLVVSKGGTHIITSSQHLAGKMVSGPLIQTGHQLPMAVSAQFLGSSGVKPVVVVSSGNHLTTPPPSSSC